MGMPKPNDSDFPPPYLRRSDKISEEDSIDVGFSHYQRQRSSFHKNPALCTQTTHSLGNTKFNVKIEALDSSLHRNASRQSSPTAQAKTDAILIQRFNFISRKKNDQYYSKRKAIRETPSVMRLVSFFRHAKQNSAQNNLSSALSFNENEFDDDTQVRKVKSESVFKADKIRLMKNQQATVSVPNLSNNDDNTCGSEDAAECFTIHNSSQFVRRAKSLTLRVKPEPTEKGVKIRRSDSYVERFKLPACELFIKKKNPTAKRTENHFSKNIDLKSKGSFLNIFGKLNKEKNVNSKPFSPPLTPSKLTESVETLSEHRNNDIDHKIVNISNTPDSSVEDFSLIHNGSKTSTTTSSSVKKRKNHIHYSSSLRYSSSEVSSSDFEKIRLIGRGDVGRVYLVRRKNYPNQLFAMKGTHFFIYFSSFEGRDAEAKKDEESFS